MSQNQKKNLGLPKYSNLLQKSKTGSQIPQTSTKHAAQSDSPYKNCLTKIKRQSLNDDDDFMTPKSIKTKPKLIKKQKPPSKKKPTKLKQSNIVFKRTKDNFENADINPDHLQMALALSKSTFAQEYPDRKEEVEETLPEFLHPKDIPKGTSFLEKYGFKSNKNQLQPESFREHLEEAKKRKNSKFRFVTPTLRIRTDDERKTLINEKISFILSKESQRNKRTNQTMSKLNSRLLEQYIYNNSNNLLNSYSRTEFTVSSLQLSHSNVPVGYLLKNWESIYGRDKSPERKCSKENTNDNEEDSVLSLQLSSCKVESINKNDNSSDGKMRDIEENKKLAIKLIPIKVFTDGSNTYSERESTENENNESNLSIDAVIAPYIHDSKGIQSNSKSIETNIYTDETGCFKSNGRCISPDLFESDDELSKTLSLNRTEKNDKGIEYFETFFYDHEQLIEKKIINKSHNTSTDIEKSVTVEQLLAEKEDLTSVMDSISFTTKKENLTVEKELVKHSIVDLTSDSDEEKISDTTKNKQFTNIKDENSLIGLKKLSSMDSGNISLEYNNSKSLNITDYIMDVLNSQEDTENEYLSQSQSTCSQESIIILSDEELNYSSRISAYNKNENIYDLDNFDDHIATGIDDDDLEKVELDLKNKYSQHESPLKSEIDDLTLKSSNAQENTISSLFKKPNTNKSSSHEPVNDLSISNEETICYSPSKSCKGKGLHEIQKKSPIKTRKTIDNIEDVNNIDYFPSNSSKGNNSIKHQEKCDYLPYKTTKMDQVEELNIIGQETQICSRQKSTETDDSVKESENVDYSPSKISSEFQNQNHSPIKMRNVDYSPSKISSKLQNQNYSPNKIRNVDYSPSKISSELQIQNYSPNKIRTVDYTPSKISSELQNQNYSPNKIRNVDYSPSKISSELQIQNYSPSKISSELHNQNYSPNKIRNVDYSPSKISSELQKQNYSPIQNRNRNEELNHSTEIKCGTPNNNLIVKTKNITPMANYDSMDTPKIVEELDKFGIKPLKRKKGVQLLKYIYESTHPLVDGKDFFKNVEQENKEKDVKKRKLDEDFKNVGSCSINIIGTNIVENEIETDLLFERRVSKKISSCAIPLQIAWYNFLCCNPALRENILLYEPIHLEVVHSMLKEQSGCNFHIEELITFLDKKCITFRTNQWQGSRKKQPKAKKSKS